MIAERDLKRAQQEADVALTGAKVVQTKVDTAVAMADDTPQNVS